MNQKHLWQLLLIIFVVAWSIVEVTPPTGRDLLQDFQSKARNKDADFTNIVARAQQLQKELPGRAYGNLMEAAATNDITKYFPNINVKGQKDPSHYVLNRLQREASGKIKLGLDLQGGTSFLVGMDTRNLSTNTERSVALGNAVEVLRKRVDKLGVAEPLLQPAGEDRILIQLPGISQAEMDSAKTIIEKAAYLEFRMVHPESDQLMAQGIVEPGYEVLREEVKGRDGSKQMVPYLVKRGAERGLTGKHLKRAYVTREQLTNKPEIGFEMDSEGEKLFGEITTEYQPKGNKKYQLAIVLDGELASAPFINGPIMGGRGVIQGNYDLKEAYDLVYVLENPLEAPVKIIEERTVEPSLGADTIKSGVTSAIYGTIAVAGFMLIYYMLAGAVANVALMTNIIILLGVMCSIGTTLTLPGIAGIVLTVGMAVDANVLIFERIREESAKGKSLKGALAAGYDRAFGTIFDSHVTTLISSLILWFMGTGSIKGFGVALTIGVAASLFTALVVTRLIFDFLLVKGWLTSIKMLHIIRATKLDFMKLAKPAFMLSWAIILVGIGYGVFGRGEKVFGVDFLGGDALTLRFAQKIEDRDKLREALTKAGISDPVIQYQKELSTGKEMLRVTSAYNTGERVISVLSSAFPTAKFEKAALDKVGPSIGKEIQQTAIVASLLSLFGILVYVAFRYEFSFAIGAVVAVIHDVLMTIGCYCLAGKEFNAPTVAAILTIIGFSINDTIVIFDRIREDLKLGVRGSFKDLINQALNQTLSRTLITSGTVLLATLSLYIFGGGAINDFAFAFLVGIITGTYSSIYIASALVLWWHKGQRPNLGSGVSMENTASARQTAGARV
jgi:SecD/SecF fusion protein